MRPKRRASARAAIKVLRVKIFKRARSSKGLSSLARLVKKVDFPKFVSGLIQNVFQAIVDSSIQQMQAYGELLANVAKTVDQFAADNITQNNARDWLAQKYPDQLDIQTTSMSGGFAEGDTPPEPQPTMVAKTDEAAQRVSQDLQMEKPVTDLSDPAEEVRLVQAARLQIARSRQQLLSFDDHAGYQSYCGDRRADSRQSRV